MWAKTENSGFTIRTFGVMAWGVRMDCISDDRDATFKWRTSMQLRNLLAATTALGCLATVGFAQSVPEPQSKLEPIKTVSELIPREDRALVICASTAQTPGQQSAYYIAAEGIAGRLERRIDRPVIISANIGGTVGSTLGMADGKCHVALVQPDFETMVGSLIEHIDDAGEIVTEAVLAFGRIDSPVTGSQSDFGWVGQGYTGALDFGQESYIFSMAGGKTSGTNLWLQNICSKDPDWCESRILYAGSWDAALDDVKARRAVAAIGAMSWEAPVWEVLDDKFAGDIKPDEGRVYLMDIDDRDLWKIRGIFDQPLYGKCEVPVNDLMDDLMDRDADGEASTVDTACMHARVIFRTDALSAGEQQALRDVVRREADLFQIEFGG